MPIAGGFSSVKGFPYIAEIRNHDGLILHPFGFEQPGPYEPALPTNSGWLRVNSGRLVTAPSFSGKDSWRVITKQISYQVVNPATGAIATETGTLIVGVDVGDINGTIHRLADIDIIVSGIVLLGLAIVGVTVVRASLGPLTDIERTAVVIAHGDLSRRVPERDPRTEVGSLGRSLNAMLTQIETAFHARTESEAAARRSETAARRSEARMRQFAADASHELRTPLTVIRGYLEYFQQRMRLKDDLRASHGSEYLIDEVARNSGAIPDGSFSGTFTDAEQASFIRRIEEESRRMASLIEDLLLLARLDRERPIERKLVDLLALTADAVKDARVIAPDRTINLAVDTDKAALVLGDEDRLRQVISNLMANALKHTPDGTQIDVRLSAVKVSSKPGVALEVADQGPGLRADQAGRVFERFYRADQARARKTGGTGLGLSIAAALVAAHGGTATVDSVPGHGAMFRVNLPLAPDVIAAADDG
jgi:two-component system OmpR family sensor kinase